MEAFGTVIGTRVAAAVGITSAVPVMLDAADLSATGVWVRDALSGFPEDVAQRVKDALMSGVGAEFLKIVKYPDGVADGTNDGFFRIRVVGFNEMFAAALRAAHADGDGLHEVVQ